LKKKDLKCGDCCQCCKVKPCPLHPDDLEPISRFLKVSVKVLIKKFLVWDFITLKKDYFYLRPKRIDENYYEKENISKINNGKGACIFLRNKRCKIYEVRPLGAETYHCKMKNREIIYTHYKSAADFKGNSMNPYPNGFIIS